MIRQLLNPDETVQTGLSLNVNGLRIDYQVCSDDLQFEFLVRLPEKEPTLLKADAAIDEVIQAIIEQNRAKGSEWELLSVSRDAQKMHSENLYHVTVYFQVK